MLTAQQSPLPDPQSRYFTLSGRQLTVLRLVCKGVRNAEIAAYMGLTERTVKGYVKQLFLIFDVDNRTELAGLLAAAAEQPHPLETTAPDITHA